jgi:hypothetical protein
VFRTNRYETTKEHSNRCEPSPPPTVAGSGPTSGGSSNGPMSPFSNSHGSTRGVGGDVGSVGQASNRVDVKSGAPGGTSRSKEEVHRQPSNSGKFRRTASRLDLRCCRSGWGCESGGARRKKSRREVSGTPRMLGSFQVDQCNSDRATRPRRSPGRRRRPMYGGAVGLGLGDLPLNRRSSLVWRRCRRPVLLPLMNRLAPGRTDRVS